MVKRRRPTPQEIQRDFAMASKAMSSRSLMPIFKGRVKRSPTVSDATSKSLVGVGIETGDFIDQTQPQEQQQQQAEPAPPQPEQVSTTQDAAPAPVETESATSVSFAAPESILGVKIIPKEPKTPETPQSAKPAESNAGNDATPKAQQSADSTPESPPPTTEAKQQEPTVEDAVTTTDVTSADDVSFDLSDATTFEDVGMLEPPSMMDNPSQPDLLTDTSSIMIEPEVEESGLTQEGTTPQQDEAKPGGEISNVKEAIKEDNKPQKTSSPGGESGGKKNPQLNYSFSTMNETGGASHFNAKGQLLGQTNSKGQFVENKKLTKNLERQERSQKAQKGGKQGEQSEKPSTQTPFAGLKTSGGGQQKIPPYNIGKDSRSSSDKTTSRDNSSSVEQERFFEQLTGIVERQNSQIIMLTMRLRYIEANLDRMGM